MVWSTGFFNRFIFIFVAFATLGSTLSHAQESQTRAAAQALFDEGLRLFDLGEFAKACPKFEASLKLNQSNGTRGKLAHCYEKQGKTASAWAAYREVAVLANRAGEERRAEVAAERATRLKASLVYLVIKNAGNTPDMTILHNDEPVSEGMLGTALAVDPGMQRIEASAPGYNHWKIEIEVGSEEQTVVGVPALALLETEKEQKQDGSVLLPQNNTWKRPAAYITGGVAGVLLLSSAALALSADSQWNDAFKNHCDANTNRCDQEGLDATSSARTKSKVGATLLGLGGLSAAAAIGLYLWSKSDDEQRIVLIPVVPATGSQTGLSLVGTF